MRYKITVEYNGRDFCGWQRQKNGRSVQEELETVLSGLFGVKTAVQGSGRTDAGVHAIGQAAHFDAETSIPVDKIPFAVNTMLPQDVKVKACEQVADDFHAQFGAKRKTYRYRLYFAPHLSPLRADLAEQITSNLDIDAMKRAAKHIEGEHDFKAFSASGGKVKTTVRTVYSVVVNRQDDELYIDVTGNGFLYNMVRIIAGTLVYVGESRIAADDIPDILASRDRKRAGKTLPACGLYLLEVKYV